MRHRYGKRLTQAAWGIEVIAASIGLFIALATIFATQAEILDERGSVAAREWMNIFIAGLPFLMVAIVELMKIPLATAYYVAQSRVWRIVFLCSLLFLIAVTFETMVNGFQRQFESRVFLITNDRTELAHVDAQVGQLGSRIDNLRAITIESVRQEHDAERESIRRDRESKLDELSSQRRRMMEQANVTETGALGAEVATIEAEIAQARDEKAKALQALRDSYGDDSSQAAAEVSSKRRSLQERLDRIAERIDETNGRYRVERAGCFFGCGAVDERFRLELARLNDERQSIAEEMSGLSATGAGRSLRVELDERIRAATREHDARIGSLRERLSALRRTIDERDSRSAEKIRPIIEQIDARRDEIIADADAREGEARERFEKRLAEAEGRDQEIGLLQPQVDALEDRRNELRNSINRRAKDNQIYQIASLWFGHDSPADVTKDELKLVSGIWFGSLAAIVALTGTILAFAGLVVRYHEPRREPRRRGPAQTLRSVRAAAVAVQRHARRRVREGPRVVTKEVPVDRVVYRDVPKEVVRKDIVYVPLYTNDPELLKLWDGVTSMKPDGGAIAKRED